jgi:hypothetical protein
MQIPRYPIIMIILCTNGCAIPDLVGVPGKRLQGGITRRWVFAFEILVSFWIACYLCASLLNHLADWIYNHCTHCGKRHWLPMTRPCRPADPIGSSIREERISLESLTPVIETDIQVQYRTISTQTSRQDPAWPQNSDTECDGDTGPLHQPSTLTDQVLSDVDHGNFTEHKNEVEQTSSASDRSVTEAVQDDETPPADRTWQQRALEKVEAISLLVGLAPFVIIFWSIGTLHKLMFGDGVDNVTGQQNAAEEGAAGPSSVDCNRESQSQHTNSSPHPKTHEMPRLLRLGIRALGVAVRWVLRPVLTLIGRLFQGVGSLYAQSFNWIWWQVTKRHPITILVNAYGLMNFSMAVVYYLVLFDGEGTSAPAWSDSLG